ncbi:ATP-dependent RNA helicase DDX19B [Trichinella spiralis]|uniref:ATP-dependent RNA helicase DDX19B n=1 Tax=Trichinella spiralis TaxID=6334 RepID=UPI0001EFC63F|nr:ATP-dependent RNA helicase DDX19B [Trichinella spiralis]
MHKYAYAYNWMMCYTDIRLTSSNVRKMRNTFPCHCNTSDGHHNGGKHNMTGVGEALFPVSTDTSKNVIIENVCQQSSMLILIPCSLHTIHTIHAFLCSLLSK